MPEATLEQIRELIDRGRVSYFTLDSNIFEAFGNNLDYPVLRKLDQFKDTQIGVVFSDIVAREVCAHIAEDAGDAQRKLKKALRNHKNRWSASYDQDELARTLDLGARPEAFAAQRFSAYVEHVGAAIVPLDGNTHPATIFDLYFAFEPPFAKKVNKQHGFPDAFALLSLEQLAARSHGMILAVSADKDWQSFAAASQYLLCTNDLVAILDLFNQSGRLDADRALAMLLEGQAPSLADSIDSAFEYRLGNANYHIEAHSDYDVETEALDAALQHWEILTERPPRIVASNSETVTFSFFVNALINFYVSIEYLIYDSVDEDYLSMGTEEVEREVYKQLEVVVALARGETGEVNPVDVEVSEEPFTVEFGDVYPDWGYEE